MISLRKVDQSNVWALLRLRVSDAQRTFVATNTESIVEAYTTLAAGGVALPFGVYADETPVGFVMLGYGAVPGENGPAVAEDSYCIWRLMIDEKYQHCGYGRAAVQQALDYIRTLPCGPARCCYLSYEMENTVAADLYHDFGFVENGEKDGDEIVAVLPL